MAEYTATVKWHRKPEEKYIDNKYSRAHEWHFDGGAVVPASSSPHVVRVPYSAAENVDPGEALVASLSSCHMLFFLAIAVKRKLVVDAYIDNPVGVLEKDRDGKISMTKIILRPEIKCSGASQPTPEVLQEIHHQSHEQCFIANSIKAEVIIEAI